MPFDWTFSSPAMVSDCLADDFKAFLDPREYIPIGKRGQTWRQNQNLSYITQQNNKTCTDFEMLRLVTKAATATFP